MGNRFINDSRREDMKFECVRLLSLGHTLVDVASLIGVNVITIRNWMARDLSFKKRIDSANEIYHRNLIEKGLKRLAHGFEEEDVKEEYIDVRELRGEKVPFKITKTIKRKSPDMKALQTLAKKYLPEFSDKDEKDINVNVKITQRDRALSHKDRLKVLEAECREVDAVDVDKLIDSPLEDFLEE